MEVVVRGFSAEDPDLVRVDGVGVSGWCVWPGAPTAGTAIDVELDVPGELSWDDAVVGAGSRRGGPLAVGTLEVHAKVIGLDEADVLSLEVAGGGILLAEVTGEVPLQIAGRDVTLLLQGVVASPTNV